MFLTTQTEIVFSSLFEKDLKRIYARGYVLQKLFSVVDTLSIGLPLELHFRDHAFKGVYSNYRECHIEPDWLLIYQYEDKKLNLLLIATGSHSELFR